MAAGLYSGAPKNSRLIPTFATTFSFMNSSTAITAPAWAPAIRPDGPRWWRSCCSKAASEKHVAYALMRAAPALVSTPEDRANTTVHTSVNAARMSACATVLSRAAAAPRPSGHFPLEQRRPPTLRPPPVDRRLHQAPETDLLPCRAAWCTDRNTGRARQTVFPACPARGP